MIFWKNKPIQRLTVTAKITELYDKDLLTIGYYWDINNMRILNEDFEKGELENNVFEIGTAMIGEDEYGKDD